MPLRDGDFQLQNVFDRKICRNWSRRSGIFFVSTKVVRRPSSNYPLHFDIGNISHTRTQTLHTSARYLLSTDMFSSSAYRRFTASRSRLITTDNWSHFKFEEMPCKLDSSQNLRWRNTQPLSLFIKDNLRYSLSHLQWVASDIFKKLAQKPQVKVRKSLFTETWQKRPANYGFEISSEFLKMSLQSTSDPTWGDIFECYFNAQSVNVSFH